jgi:hypothetical protein
MPHRLLAGVLVLLSTSLTHAAVESYVSPDGHDANPDTRERPFVSLDHAQRAVAQRADRWQSVTVFLVGGTYYLPDTLVFQAADHNELACVTVQITDASGNVLSDATNLVRFTLSGSGELAAVGSGAPDVIEGFQQPQHTAWHGRCLAILRPKGDPGNMTLKAEPDGLEAAAIAVNAHELKFDPWFKTSDLPVIEEHERPLR